MATTIDVKLSVFEILFVMSITEDHKITYSEHITHCTKAINLEQRVASYIHRILHAQNMHETMNIWDTKTTHLTEKIQVEQGTKPRTKCKMYTRSVVTCNSLHIVQVHSLSTTKRASSSI